MGVGVKVALLSIAFTTLSVRRIVLIGDDLLRRMIWPIANVTELIAGKDEEVRAVGLKIQHGTVLRTVQRIFFICYTSK